MAMMTGLVQLEVGESGRPENERITRAPINAVYSLVEQGQGRQTQNSRELPLPRRHERTVPALQGVPL